MASVESTRIVDDLTGGTADETVVIGIDGGRFEIDLSAANAERLRADLAPFLAVARPADTPGARRARGRAQRSTRAVETGGPGTDAAARKENQAVREWAREHGYPISARGRIPAEVLDAYRAGRPGALPTVPAERAPAPARETEPEPAPEAEPAQAEPESTGPTRTSPFQAAEAPAAEQPSPRDSEDDPGVPMIHFSG
ncbi:histone-like nucleoid-structuring protein Lsr2 [Pseudonocardia phyllosphaerae]|uniref:histone-like nucleoid-structuring protein Lsr2 n=1 Tax=Pseudonocardia phyllosphaerae TaxID=3390502 RepID=UPI003978BEB2